MNFLLKILKIRSLSKNMLEVWSLFREKSAGVFG